MSKVKNTKKSSVMKVVGIVFLIVTLIIAVSLTNNTVRQMISSSFAFDYECGAKGSPSARHECQQRNDDNRRSAAIRASDNQFNSLSVWLGEQVNQGRLTFYQYKNIMDGWSRNLRLDGK